MSVCSQWKRQGLFPRDKVHLARVHPTLVSHSPCDLAAEGSKTGDTRHIQGKNGKLRMERCSPTKVSGKLKACFCKEVAIKVGVSAVLRFAGSRAMFNRSSRFRLRSRGRWGLGSYALGRRIRRYRGRRPRGLDCGNGKLSSSLEDWSLLLKLRFRDDQVSIVSIMTSRHNFINQNR